MSPTLSPAQLEEAITRTAQWSSYLQRRLQNFPQEGEQLRQDALSPMTAERIQAWWAEMGGSVHTPLALASCIDAAGNPDETAIQAALEPLPNVDLNALKRILRLWRRRIFLTLMVRDIAGAAPLEEVVGCMSAMADWAVARSYDAVFQTLAKTHGIPWDLTYKRPMEMLILGMGKLGGQELNVSSDIDLIMLYAENGETRGGRRPISHFEFFAKLTQRMMPVLSDNTADGFVFRTDLRLRPDGDSGPLAWCLNALEQYLMAQGREWERYAWLKARRMPVRFFADSADNAQDDAAIEALRRPFVYRKYLDFDTLSSLRQLHGMITQDWSRRTLQNKQVEDAQQNIKLGRGGIREVEFIVQVTQLIRGGRLPALRVSPLVQAVQAQVAARLIEPQTADRLLEAYRFLRRTEHLLQYREDAQTHLLPADSAQMTQLAEAFGMPCEAFTQALQSHRQFVHTLFNDVFHTEREGQAAQDSAAQAASAPMASAAAVGAPSTPSDDSAHHLKPRAPTPTLRDIGEQFVSAFGDEADEMNIHFQQFWNTPRVARLSNHNQLRLMRLMPSVLESAAQTQAPKACFQAFLRLLEAIVPRSSYIALLVEYPSTVKRVAQMMAASQWAAQYLIDHPMLLDMLIDDVSRQALPDRAQLSAHLKEQLDCAMLPNGKPDIEHQMNLLRDFQKQQSFQILATDLAGLLSVESVADHLSLLADVILEETMHRIWCNLQPERAKAHEKPKFGIIAYGKLGGKELSYTSDLDLVLVFNDEAHEAMGLYTKMGQRLSTWLSTLTSSGRLYEVDYKLRPEGTGPLAVSIDGFVDYLRHKAWTWEHQALTRARFVTGDPSIEAAFNAIRTEILTRPRDPKLLREEIIDMRLKITQGHRHDPQMMHLKYDVGGMVDVEFCIQYLVLAHSKDTPILLENLGNINLLHHSAQAGLLPMDIAQAAASAYRSLRAHQHALGLAGLPALMPPERLSEERKAITDLWSFCFPAA